MHGLEMDGTVIIYGVILGNYEACSHVIPQVSYIIYEAQSTTSDPTSAHKYHLFNFWTNSPAAVVDKEFNCNQQTSLHMGGVPVPVRIPLQYSCLSFCSDLNLSNLLQKGNPTFSTCFEECSKFKLT